MQLASTDVNAINMIYYVQIHLPLIVWMKSYKIHTFLATPTWIGTHPTTDQQPPMGLSPVFHHLGVGSPPDPAQTEGQDMDVGESYISQLEVA